MMPTGSADFREPRCMRSVHEITRPHDRPLTPQRGSRAGWQVRRQRMSSFNLAPHWQENNPDVCARQRCALVGV